MASEARCRSVGTLMMNAYVSKEELALLPANRISYPQHYAEASQRRSGWLGTFVERIRTHLQIQATLRELNTLTDRELADIGLSRSTLVQAVARFR